VCGGGRSKSRPVPCTPALQVDADDDVTDYKDDSESRKRICSCKKSRCLKLYCECFAAGDLCDGCKCVSCANDGEHETQRLVAVDNIKQRNALAFAPKIVDEEMDKPVGAHARGCRCKKSHCLKKYCECFQSVSLPFPPCAVCACPATAALMHCNEGGVQNGLLLARLLCNARIASTLMLCYATPA